jgi:hypothetical protein
MIFYRYSCQDSEPRQIDVTFDDYRAHRTGLQFTHCLDRYVPNATGWLNFGYDRFTYPETDTETNVVIGTVELSGGRPPIK